MLPTWGLLVKVKKIEPWRNASYLGPDSNKWITRYKNLSHCRSTSFHWPLPRPLMCCVSPPGGKACVNICIPSRSEPPRVRFFSFALVNTWERVPRGQMAKQRGARQLCKSLFMANTAAPLGSAAGVDAQSPLSSVHLIIHSFIRTLAGDRQHRPVYSHKPIYPNDVTGKFSPKPKSKLYRALFFLSVLIKIWQGAPLCLWCWHIWYTKYGSIESPTCSQQTDVPAAVNGLLSCTDIHNNSKTRYYLGKTVVETV